MKLIIQIPCYNEEKTLPATLKDLPKKIEGVDEIETLIIDDGSTDKTIAIAQKQGVEHIVSFPVNRGLAKAFDAGIDYCLQHGADIIVNTDGDNQYRGADIAELVQPIVEGQADVVIGDRQTDKIEHFSRFKRWLQRMGTSMINKLAHTHIDDAVSGFRAFSREAAANLNITTLFSYTTESLIQLSEKRFAIVSVPIRTNQKLRVSRLFRNLPHFLIMQAKTIIRVYSHYKALRIFTALGLLVAAPGVAGIVRFLIYYFSSEGAGKIQSLIISVMLILIGVVIFLVGILADMISTNRVLIEKLLSKQFETPELNEDKKEDTV
jgi:glycosyltransferase involved in cell wall biosynthesis